MRKVIYSMGISLDGLIAGPQGELDWHVVDEELLTYINDQQRALDTHLYGRRLYENMAAYWPTADQDPAAPAWVLDFARIWKSLNLIVFSRTLQQVAGNARLLREVNAEEIRRLKATPGKDFHVGGANLAATFMRLGLIDEYQLFVNPVVVGRGIPMFPALDQTLKLRLIETHPFSSGVTLLRYVPADEG